MDISILIPVYNSTSSLHLLYQEIEDYFLERDFAWEVVFVDDASTAPTKEVLQSLKDANPSVRLLTLQKNLGQQKALYLGLQQCQGEYVLTMDDDLQHDIRYLEALLKESGAGADLVFGISQSFRQPFWRTWGSRQIGWFFKRRFPALKGQKVSSYRLIHRSVYQHLSASPSPFLYLSAELIPWSTHIANVPIHRRQRLYGRSGHGFWKCALLATKLWLQYGRKNEVKP